MARSSYSSAAAVSGRDGRLAWPREEDNRIRVVSNPLAEAGPGALASGRSTLDVVRVQGMEVDIGEAVEAAVRAPTAAHWRQR